MIEVEKFEYIDDIQSYINQCTLCGQREYISKIDEHIDNLCNTKHAVELSCEIFDNYQIQFDKTYAKQVMYELDKEILYVGDYRKRVNDAIKIKQERFCEHHWKVTSYSHGGTEICTLCGKERG